jgi:nitrite reductase (NO-forming)
VAGARVVEVAATEFTFRPLEIEVKAGEVINLRLVNQGAAAHDITVPGLGLWIAAPVGQAVTGAVRVDRSGTYEFFCSVPGHREAGMVGRIVVTP